MEKDIQTLLETTSYHPEQELSRTVWLSIRQRTYKKAHHERILYGTLSIASIAILIPVSISIHAQLQESGFMQYLSVLFSDTGSIGIFGKQLLYALEEALPTLSIAVFLFLLGGLGFSLKAFFSTQTHAQLAIA